jgi:hypothetical protein
LGWLNPAFQSEAAADGVEIYDAIKPNFSFQPGGGSGIKWRMQTIGACPRRAFAKPHLSSNEPHSFESRVVAVPTVSKLKKIPL